MLSKVYRLYNSAEPLLVSELNRSGPFIRSLSTGQILALATGDKVFLNDVLLYVKKQSSYFPLKETPSEKKAILSRALPSSPTYYLTFFTF